MKVESTEMQERAQQLWRELDGLDWSSHEQAIVGIIRDALEQAYQDGKESAVKYTRGTPGGEWPYTSDGDADE
jgi:hypothetical protein